MSRARLHGASRAAINSFIIFHLLAIWAWCLPESFAMRAALTGPIERYVVGLGLWQGWDMFSPNPRTVNIRVGAEVEYAGGEIEPYEFPQMDRLGFLDRYRRERFRKWANDNMRLDRNPDLWRPAAEWVMKQHDGGRRPVVKVRLYRRWWDVPKPEAADAFGRLDRPATDRREHMFYELKRPLR